MLSYTRIAQVVEDSSAAVLVSVVASHGSTPRKVGARMLVFADGHTEGTVGGGAIEYRAIAMAATFQEQDEARSVDLDLAKDVGMSCGGRVTLMFEPLGRSPEVLLFGAGHIALALSRLLGPLGFAYRLIDDRPEFANEQRFPEALQIMHSFSAKALADVAIGSHSFAVVTTYKHLHDEDCVRLLLPRGPVYIGIMGSRRKSAVVKRNLLRDGFEPEQVRALHSPVGMDISAETPEEIALSIAAELVQVRRRRARVPRVAALIAAAGRSQRMGSCKALLKLDGEPLVRRLALTLMAAGARPCLVTLPEDTAEAQAIEQALQGIEVVTLRNRSPEQGLIGSIRSALDLVERSAQALMVAPVDQPFVDRDLATRLIEAASLQSIVVPLADAQRAHPTVFGRRHFAALRSPLCDQGARELVADESHQRIEIEARDPRMTQPLNTPEEAAALGVMLAD